MIFSILITLELSPQIIIALVLWILEIVFAVRGCLPDIDDCTWDALAGDHVGDLAVHECWLTVGVGVLDDGTAEFAEGGAW